MQPEHLDVHPSYGHHYLTWNEPATAAPGACLPNTEIFRRLARALGLEHLHTREDCVAITSQSSSGRTWGKRDKAARARLGEGRETLAGGCSGRTSETCRALPADCSVFATI